MHRTSLILELKLTLHADKWSKTIKSISFWILVFFVSVFRNSCAESWKKENRFHFNAFPRNTNASDENDCISNDTTEYTMPAGRRNATHTNGANSNFQCIPAMKNYFMSESHIVCTCVAFLCGDSSGERFNVIAQWTIHRITTATTNKKKKKKNEIKI